MSFEGQNHSKEVAIRAANGVLASSVCACGGVCEGLYWSGSVALGDHMSRCQLVAGLA